MINKIKKAVFNIKLLITLLLLITGSFIIYLGINNLDLKEYRDVLINLGSGFIGSAIVTIIIENMLIKEVNEIDEKKLKEFALILLEKSGILINKAKIIEIIDENHLNLSITNESLNTDELKKIIAKYIIQKSNNNKTSYEIDTLSIINNEKHFNILLSNFCLLIKEIKEKFKNTDKKVLYEKILIPKTGNIFFGYHMGKKLQKPCVYHTYKDPFFSEEHLYECDIEPNENSKYIVIHDVVVSGTRIINLVDNLLHKGHTVQHVFALIYRSDNNREALQKLKTRNIEFHYLIELKEDEIKRLSKSKIN